ncbi:MAG TPA: hypothetical protein V6D29_18915 [Leptolyngbyaceae cyanobacterium]
MASTHTCLWCRNVLLRHVRRSGIYWFCNSCRQEIHPLLVDFGHTQRVKSPLQELSDRVEVKIPLKVSPSITCGDSQVASLMREAETDAEATISA